MGKFKLCITGDLGFEVWQDIPGYEGKYQASTYGRVRSLDRYVVRGKQTALFKGKIIKPCFDTQGYNHIEILGKTQKIHRLAALTFLPRLNEEHVQINHKDENKSNNRIENLEWCTAKYNVNYGTRGKRAGNAQKNSPKRSKKVLQFDLDGNFIAEYPSIHEVSRVNGCLRAPIGRCCENKQKKAYGYKWRYE